MIKNVLGLVALLFTLNASAGTETMKEAVDVFMQENNISGVAVIAYVNGKPVEHFYGHTDAAKKVPITVNTIFTTDSLNNLLTSLLLAQQVDAARAQLGESVTQYLPDLPDKDEDITLGNLATYTADPVDEQWKYSNVSMDLLRRILEKTSHMTLEQLYRKNIFTPLKMSHTTTTKIPVVDVRRFLATAIGLPGTSERLFYQMRMTQASYVKTAMGEQGLGWQIHPFSADQAESLLDESNLTNMGPLPITDIYDIPKFNGDALIDQIGMAGQSNFYIALLPNKQSGVVILTTQKVSNDEIIPLGRDILLQLTGLLPDAG